MSKPQNQSTCPLCRRQTGTLEFHHWDYDEDIGVEICEECHNTIHGGEDGRVAVQQNRAEHYYGEEGHWHIGALKNLAQRDIQYLSEDEFDINDTTGFGEYWQYLRERYNLPPDEKIGSVSTVKSNLEGGMFAQVKHGFIPQGRRRR